MNLTLIHEARCASIYYDTWNDWLFIDWYGDLTLPAVQSTCLALAKCFLLRSYPRVLNSNLRITDVGWEVAATVAHELMPYLDLAGIHQLAWVYAPSLRGQAMANEIMARMPSTTVVLFNDMSEAIAWLQRTKQVSKPGQLPVPSATVRTQMVNLIKLFIRKLNIND